MTHPLPGLRRTCELRFGETVIPLNSKRSGTPLFLVHDGLGEVLLYRSLALTIGAPVYGLMPDGGDHRHFEPVAGLDISGGHGFVDLEHKIDPAKQKMAYYPANMMPVPNDLRPQPVDRKKAMTEAAHLETPDGAAERVTGGKPPPPQYAPTPPDPEGPIGEDFKPTVYGGGTEKAKAQG